jgi:hypothetical protein
VPFWRAGRLSSADVLCVRSVRGGQAPIGSSSRGAACRRSALAEQRLCDGGVERHAELAVVAEGVDEHRARPLVFVGVGLVEEHLAVPSAGLVDVRGGSGSRPIAGLLSRCGFELGCHWPAAAVMPAMRCARTRSKAPTGSTNQASIERQAPLRASIGRCTWKVAPAPGLVSSSTRPPCASTSVATTASPSPVPPRSRARDGSAR